MMAEALEDPAVVERFIRQLDSSLDLVILQVSLGQSNGFPGSPGPDQIFSSKFDLRPFYKI